MVGAQLLNQLLHSSHAHFNLTLEVRQCLLVNFPLVSVSRNFTVHNLLVSKSAWRLLSSVLNRTRTEPDFAQKFIADRLRSHHLLMLGVCLSGLRRIWPEAAEPN